MKESNKNRNEIPNSEITLLEVKKEKVKFLEEIIKYSTLELEQTLKILKVISKEIFSTDEVEFVDFSTLPILEKSRSITIAFGINKIDLQECFNQEMVKKEKEKTQLSTTTDNSKNLNSNLNYEKENKESKSTLKNNTISKKIIPTTDPTFSILQETEAALDLESQIHLEKKEIPPKTIDDSTSFDNLDIDTEINDPSISNEITPKRTKTTRSNLKLLLI